MKEYKFYGWQTADCKPADSSYEKIATEVDTKEIKDNKDNQSVIVIES